MITSKIVILLHNVIDFEIDSRALINQYYLLTLRTEIVNWSNEKMSHRFPLLPASVPHNDEHHHAHHLAQKHSTSLKENLKKKDCKLFHFTF